MNEKDDNYQYFQHNTFPFTIPKISSNNSNHRINFILYPIKINKLLNSRSILNIG